MSIFGKNKNSEKEKGENPTPEKKPNDSPAESSGDTAGKTGFGEIPREIPKFTVQLPEDSAEEPAKKNPESIDFNRYFLPERRIALENVSYETERPRIPSGSRVSLAVKDTVIAHVMLPNGVKVTFNRTLSFQPDGPFTLSVSFSTMLIFNPGTRDEIDWKTVDVADEFKKNCPGLMQNMMSRASLLVGQITSAAGGTPIVPIK